MQRPTQLSAVLLALVILLVFFGRSVRAQHPAEPQRTMTPPNGLTPLARDADVWIDIERQRVVVDGHVTLRAGQLEMFACSKGTKEHESIVAVNSKAQYVHAGLLAIGAKSGQPVRFDPEYQPATGSTIDIFVLWIDAAGKKHQVRAQEWIKNTRTGKPCEAEWVFAGSGFWTDPTSGQRFYHGDGGDFICVSNFPTATLDLTIPSSQANSELLFEAFTERIPPTGTHVRLVLIPQQAATADTNQTRQQPSEEAPSEKQLPE